VTGYVIDPHYDPDLVEARERGPHSLAVALATMCVCGHPRSDHMGATGALASFGGTACNSCWSCGTFTAVAS
jgi:hypothetical protein